jgi:iron complex transport system substrate-binding protein
VQPSRIRERAGWQTVSAVANDRIFEVKSTYILQPGPAALTDGVGQIHQILCGIHGFTPQIRP